MASNLDLSFSRPVLSHLSAKLIVEKCFGIKTMNEDSIAELDSYEDRNFLIASENDLIEADGNHVSKRYILKVFNAKHTYSQPGVLEATDATMLHVNEQLHHNIATPVPLPTVNANLDASVKIAIDGSHWQQSVVDFITNYAGANDDNSIVLTNDLQSNATLLVHQIRLLPFLPGERISSTSVSDRLLFDVGELAADLSNCLESFSHLALEHKMSLWDMKNIMILRQDTYVNLIEDSSLRGDIERFFERYAEVVLEILPRLPKQIIHSDMSRGNILVNKRKAEYEICGLIDFGDVSYSYRVLEISNCMADIGMLRKHQINDCHLILAGFLSKANLNHDEWAVLLLLILGRHVQCIIMGHYQNKNTGENNEYINDINATSVFGFQEFLPYLGREHEILDIWKRDKECV